MNQLNKNQYAPIVLFVYNRLEHVTRTVCSLLTNDLSRESELFIYSDGPKDDKDSKIVRNVRGYLKTISGFKTIQIIEKRPITVWQIRLFMEFRRFLKNIQQRL